MAPGECYTLWVERVADRLGFDRVAISLIDDPSAAPYFYILFVLIVDVPVLSTVGYVFLPHVTFHPFLHYPSWIVNPFALLIGIWGMRRIRSNYSEAIENTGRISSPIEVSSPEWVRLSVYVVAIVLYLIAIWPTLPEHLAREGLLLGGVKWLGIIPLVYIPVIAEFSAVCLHGILVLPITVYYRDIQLDFGDPMMFGGMVPVGSLVVSATKFYYVGFGLWTLESIIGSELGDTEMRTLSTVFFAAVWTVGAVLFLFTTFLMHRHMSRQRNGKLESIASEIQELRHQWGTFPLVFQDTQDEKLDLILMHINFSWVKETRTYPMNVDRLWELFAAAVLPVLLQFGPLVTTLF